MCNILDLLIYSKQIIFFFRIAQNNFFILINIVFILTQKQSPCCPVIYNYIFSIVFFIFHMQIVLFSFSFSSTYLHYIYISSFFNVLFVHIFSFYSL